MKTKKLGRHGTNQVYSLKAMNTFQSQSTPTTGTLESSIQAQVKIANATIRSSASNSSKTARKCNCKKSKCLKGYCDCFASGGFCLPSCEC